jgi:hypothetical protein
MPRRAASLTATAVLALVLAVGAVAGCGTTDAEGRGCPPCPLGMTCVERFDGVCSPSSPICVATTETCAPNTCSSACQQALCPSPYQCQNRPPCGTEAAGAFLCYGP